VGNQELSPINWQVLGRFPKIDELHFNQGKRLGVPQHIAKSLSCSIMSFQGTSLVFSGWKMSERPKVDTVVSQLRLEAITSVFVDQSPLCFKYGTSCGPLFPNLRKVKYSGSRWTTIPCANRQGFQDISQSRKTGYYWHSVTLFYHQDAALLSLSQVHKYSREICIQVGLFRKVLTSGPWEFKLPEQKRGLCGIGLIRRYYRTSARAFSRHVFQEFGKVDCI